MATHATVNNDWMDSALQSQHVSIARHATLTFTIGVGFNFINAGTYQGQDHIDWDDRSKNWFKSNLKTVVERAWSDRFYLVPDTDWSATFTVVHGGNMMVRVSPAIRCRLILNVNAADPHMKVNVRRLPKDPVSGLPATQGAPGYSGPYAFMRSTMYVRQSARRQRGAVRGDLDTGDVIPRAGAGTQIPAVHEFGHYIGLHHDQAPQVAAGTATNEYGPTNIMGSGTNFADWNAHPWCHRLRRHLVGPTRGTLTAGNAWTNISPHTWQTWSGILPGRRDLSPPPGPVTWSITQTAPGMIETSRAVDLDAAMA